MTAFEHPSSVTDPDQGRSTLARISCANVPAIYADFKGLDLMDSLRRLDGQDHPPTDQQPPGQTEVEPISAGTPYMPIAKGGNAARINPPSGG